MDARQVIINGQRGLVSRNTIPGQLAWRATWFDDDEEDGGVCGHIDIHESDAAIALRGDAVEIETQGQIFYIDPLTA